MATVEPVEQMVGPGKHSGPAEETVGPAMDSSKLELQLGEGVISIHNELGPALGPYLLNQKS